MARAPHVATVVSLVFALSACSGSGPIGPPSNSLRAAGEGDAHGGGTLDRRQLELRGPTEMPGSLHVRQALILEAVGGQIV